ncbi:MAG TPA: hypothetical protein VGH27_08185 [Streptosporangiaceae bacterium]|jgi:hypothetical protein
MTGTVDLYAEEQVLRGPESRFVRAAGITFGRPTVGPVPDTELPAADQRRPDLLSWRFTQLRLPFDLEDLPAGRHYVEATVRMTFDDPEVRSLVLSLLPSADGPEDSDTDTWGVGRGELTWKLAARNPRVGIRPNGRQVHALLESPMGTDRLTGSLDGTVRFIRRMLGLVSESIAEPKQPLRFVLNVADGAFAVAAG